jgi:uncharacterized protein (TIGR02217 family)
MVDLVVLDERLSYGFRSIPRWDTDIIALSSGHERRRQRRTQAIHGYQIGYTLEAADAAALRAFFHGRRGRARPFLMKDWADYQLSSELIGTGDGATVAFQAVKSYDADNPWVRTIRYLKAGTITVTVAGSPVVPSSTTLGLITLASAPTVGQAVRITAEFYVPVRFEADEMPIALTNPNVAEISGVDIREVLA